MTPTVEENGLFYHGKYKHLAASIVWTPIPLLTWFLPFLGHVGIVTTTGALRDFAGSNHVPVDDMAFGRPTKYLKIDLQKVSGGPQSLDNAINEACEIYKKRSHNLLCDNCHDFVSLALNNVGYNNGGYNTLKLAACIFFFGRYVDVFSIVKSWLPSIIVFSLIITFISVY